MTNSLSPADPFYTDILANCLQHDRCCVCCGDLLWYAYGHGHVWDHCLTCWPDGATDQGALDLAGYITSYEGTGEPLPEWVEMRRMNREREQSEGPHEGKFYRRKLWQKLTVYDKLTLVPFLGERVKVFTEEGEDELRKVYTGYCGSIEVFDEDKPLCVIRVDDEHIIADDIISVTFE
jgi:hypothetical protein